MGGLAKTLAGMCLIVSLFAFNVVSASESQVGDCVGLFFSQPESRLSAQAKPIVARAIDEGWAVRLVDVTQEPSIPRRWNVDRYPTLILVRGGKEVQRISSFQNYAELSARMLAASSPESIRIKSARSGVAHASLNSVPASPSHAFHSTGFQDGFVRSQSPSSAIPLAAAAINAAAIHSNSTANLTVNSIGGTQSAPLPSHQVAADSRPHNPAEATVRIRVDEPSHEAIGTGTIIDTYQGEALVLTCGHLFRDVDRNAKIIVETFVGGVAKSHVATLIDFRADQADIGLIAFKPDGPIATARLMDHRERLQEGQAVFSWGCDNGSDPSRRDSRITKLNRYLGEPNVEVYGAPVQGRSGGGLFNAKGELIGVCYAADNELNEGLYNAPEVVYQQLNRLGLQRLYDQHHATPNRVASNQPTAPIPATPVAHTAQVASPRMTVVIDDGMGGSQRLEIANPTQSLLQNLRNESVLR